MAIDLDTPEGKMFKQMARDLHERRTGRVGGRQWSRTTAATIKIRPGLELLADYRRGDPPLNRIHQGWADYVREFIRIGRLNIAGLTVSSTRNRIDVRGFRTAAADDEQGDKDADRIIRHNGLKVKFRDLHDDTLTMGDGYTLTVPPLKGESIAVITNEDPRDMITLDDPRTGRPKAGVKIFRDDWDSEDLAFLYLPDGKIRVARKSGRTTLNNSPFRFDEKAWLFDDAKDTDVKRFPIVHYRNEGGHGEFEEHLDALDRINDKIFNEWWIGKIQAFRQRAVKNLPDEDDEGNELDYTDMFTASPDAMWQVPEDVEFWESTPINLDPIVTSIQKDLERYAAAVSQPLHTITPDAANGSAEGASLMREEHLYKISDRIDRFGPGHAETIALAFFMQGDTRRSDRADIDPIFGPTERFSLSQKADGAQKLVGVLPQEAIWTDVLQYSPTDVERLRALRGKDMLYGAGQQRPAPAPAPTPAGGNPGADTATFDMGVQ